ncbi:hypothetical protein NUITMVRA1_06540 [Aerococcus viridans]|nr:hypothetical protein NUITMVRA1_06540 [Aerococcus viridans]
MIKVKGSLIHHTSGKDYGVCEKPPRIRYHGGFIYVKFSDKNKGGAINKIGAYIFGLAYLD